MKVAVGDFGANACAENRQQPSQFGTGEPEANFPHCLLKAYQFRSCNLPALVVRRPMILYGVTQASARNEARMFRGWAKADRIKAITGYVRQRVAKFQQKGNDAVAGPCSPGVVNWT